MAWTVDYKKIADVLIDFIKTNKRVPWDSGLIREMEDFFGVSATGKPFKGINIILSYIYMTKKKYDNNTFLTIAEVNKRGGRVKAGEKSQPILRARWGWYNKELDKWASPKKGLTREMLASMGYKLTWTGWQIYNEFNISQTTLEYEPMEPIKERELVNGKAKEIVDGYKDGPKVRTDELLRCPCYVPDLDIIKIQPQQMFKSEAQYYDSLFHEMIHSTGHESRLDRKFGNHGTKGYAKEETIAEIGAAMLMADSEFAEEDYLLNDAEYINTWLRRLENDTEKAVLEIQTSFTKAFDAKNYILGIREGEKA